MTTSKSQHHTDISFQSLSNKIGNHHYVEYVHSILIPYLTQFSGCFHFKKMLMFLFYEPDISAFYFFLICIFLLSIRKSECIIDSLWIDKPQCHLLCIPISFWSLCAKFTSSFTFLQLPDCEANGHLCFQVSSLLYPINSRA